MYIAPQAATAAAAALYVTDRADVQSTGCRLSPQTGACSLTAKQPAALVCRLKVSTPYSLTDPTGMEG